MRLPTLVASIGIVLLAGLMLSACQTSVPMPFSDDDSGQEASAPVLAEARSIEVETVDGPAVPMARLLAQAVADSLADRDIPATANGIGGSFYTLKSKARTNRDASSETIVHIDWTLMDREGGVVGTHTMGVQGSWWEWVNGDPKIIRKIGLDTAKVVADMLRDPADIQSAQAAPRALRVRPVTGAPGDGNKSLTQAIAVALRASDVAVTNDADQAMADLRGTVEVAPPDKHGQQVVRISWRVDRPDGSLVGEANQENAVPAGSLPGARAGGCDQPAPDGSSGAGSARRRPDRPSPRTEKAPRGGRAASPHRRPRTETCPRRR